ncbi:hypothetical protein Q0Z83_027950 [Actinoplanes sichuanensis]|uniref:Uncharacterized protein n=1 Tax=Actinoplanes sichuanensis TaxID=512349 RepID=A0ABW4AV84_9ACTN|nr:hypothetical protein [Actinoplanes sichuanensis]BEL04604.1 hypothetical protein Q0Z83_027950 [Actinoplanes sichuanensis]
MTAIIALTGAIIGAVVGTIATYLTSRSNMRLTLEHSYDQTMQGKRLERYQELFHVSRRLPRYWPPTEEQPKRTDLQQYIEEFHDWYFSENAGGMFLTPASMDIYMKLLNALAEAAFKDESVPDGQAGPTLSDAESQTLRHLAAELRRQLAQDVGAANPPRLRWTRPNPQPPLPSISSRR